MKRADFCWLSSCALLVPHIDAQAAQLVRQPYLQRGTPTSITICWRTDVATDSVVRYGKIAGVLDQTASAPATDAVAPFEHVVTISNLSPGTKYYYEVGSSSEVLAAADPQRFFVTSPPAGSSTEFTAWIVGDSGTGDANQAKVRDAMLAATGSTPPNIFIHVGDMAYNSGNDDEFTSKFYVPYQTILSHTVCWPTIGNHEATTSDSDTQTGPYYEGYVLPTGGEAGGLSSGTEAYYSFDYANVHFICLDSHDTPRSPESPMLTWLTADLAATDQNWVIAFWHHPPYSKGTHDSDSVADSGGRMRDMREYVLPILEAGGVDLVLAGHSHIYERSFLVDGAYDTPTTATGHIRNAGDGRAVRTGRTLTSTGAYKKTFGLTAHEGAVYVVAGHGGASLGGAANHPLMYFSELEFGSCLLRVDGNVLSFENIRHDGVISDAFDLVKPPPGDTDQDGDVDPPTLTSIEPNSGPAAGGTAIQILGTNFLSGASVTIGGRSATSVQFVSATRLDVTTPEGDPGAVDVVVINPGAQPATLTGGFSYEQATTPTASGCAPSGTALVSLSLLGLYWTSKRRRA